MTNALLSPIQAAKNKAEPGRVPTAKQHASVSPDVPHFLSTVGNMAIQRHAAGPLAGNSAAPSILGGANMSAGGCSCGGTCEECKKKQIQRKSDADIGGIPPSFHSALRKSGSGMPLSPGTRSYMESRFGDRFDDVRVHNDGAADDAARDIQAHAFTMGRDIYFGQGRYEPQTTSGNKLLAHELTHVLQQRQGVVPPGLKSLRGTPQGDVFEREAEQAEAAIGHDEHVKPSPVARPPHTSFVSDHRPVQRKCACGGTCSSCSSASPTGQTQGVRKHPLQMKAVTQGELAASRTGRNEDEPRTEHALPAQQIQKKSASGESCSKCSEDQEPKSLSLQRKAAEPALSFMKEKHGPDTARGQTKHGTAKKKSAAPPTSSEPKPAPVAGNSPGRGRENRQGTTRNTASRMQRSATAPSSGKTAAHSDKFEREAVAAANTVGLGLPFSSDRISHLDHESVQPLSWEWCNPFSDPDCGISSTASVVAGEAEEIASEVWDAAKDFADFVGGVLEYIDNLIDITIPPLHVCDPHSVQFELPELGIDVPFLAGVLPLGVVEIYGALGLHLGLIPEITLELGPCETHEIHIEIHPLSLSGAARGGGEITVGLGLGGHARIGIFGEVGAIVAWPDPPLVVELPAVRLEAGIDGFIRGIAKDRFIFDISASAGLRGFSFSSSFTNDLGLALDMGFAGNGKLAVLFQNLCTLYWPLAAYHKDTVLSLGLGLGLDVGVSSSPSLKVDPEWPSFSKVGWDDLGAKIQRDTHKDDCPLCDFLRAHKMMPSDFGGKWTGTPAWPVGPLEVFKRDPKIASESLCRGACGANCDTCKHEKEHRECVDVPGDRHAWWVYPNYEDCQSHLGCRNHDGCYDWCATKGFGKGPFGIYVSPCHRWCDFECLCNYNLPQCVGWIGGKPPYDQKMHFSDMPHLEPGCKGPCPHKEKHKDGGESWVICLPTIELFPHQKAAAKPLHEETGKYTLWKKHVWIPYVGLVSLEIYGSGKLDAGLSAGLGPGTMHDICFDVDPHTGKYKARGQLSIPANFDASLTASAELGADASWFLIVKVASAKGTLEATGRLRGDINPTLTGEVELSCKHGKPTLESDLTIPGCLKLAFDLNAGFEIKTLGFTVFTRKWNLFGAKFEKCWDEDVELKHSDTDPKIDLRDKTISLTDLLKWLLSDEAEQTEPPDKKREVKENPLTAATARTIPELAPQLDQPNHGTDTVILRSGASNTVGVDMMTRFLTDRHGPGSDRTGNAQKNIYGFGKLPTLRAFGGSGFEATQVYIKGHLLNAKLGGPAEDRNLFPITGQANKDHNVDVEEEVKRLVHSRLLVTMYGVRVSGQSDPQEIDVLGDGSCKYEFLNANFDCTYGTYTLYTDNTVELNPTTDKTINSLFDLSGFIAGVRAKNCPEK